MFPVLRLPPLAFENIYKHWKVAEIIRLSQCSKCMRNIVKSMAKCGEKTLEVSVEKRYTFIQVFSKKKERLFAWRICLETMCKPENLSFVDQIFEGKSWRIAKSFYTPGWVSATQRDRLDQDTLFVVQFFKDVFRCSIDKIELRFRGNDKFDKLLQSTSILHTAHYIRITMEDLSQEEMNFMLDNLVAEELDIAGDGLFQYSYHKPVLRFPNISIGPAQWITGADFMEMAETCKKIHLYVGNNMTNQDLNTFTKAWLAGTNETLETVNIYREFSSVDPPAPREAMYANVILNGIEGTRINDAHSQVKVEIKRADGKVANVIIQQGEARRAPSFSFTVVK